jgi:O-acetyl-ADP-ribose deacetylase (regulator of RNase III)
MEFSVGNSSISFVCGDITAEATDAIVNAANTQLAGGGGVDGAIHRAGGPAVMEECRRIGGCPTGSAVITGGGRLKARHVIHTVGPVYNGRPKDAELLASAYRSSLELAVKHGLKSVSFPSISTGAYRYPIENASRIAIRTVIDFLKAHPEIELVRFVLNTPADHEVYLLTAGQMLKS